MEKKESAKPFQPPPTSQDYAPMPEQPILEVDEKTNRRLRQTKTEFNAPANITPLPLRNENHAYILVNVTHRDQRPKNMFPGFRILGAFPDPASVTQHVNQYFKGSDCSMFVTPAHQLMAICSSTDRQQNLDYNKKHIDTLVQLHNDAAEKRDTDFKDNVAQRKTGDLGKSMFAKQHTKKKHVSKRKEIMKEKFDTAIKDLKKTSVLSSSACIAKQNFAAVIILSDMRNVALTGEKDQEPLLAVLDVFGTEEEATNYAKYTASKQYPKCAIDIVDLYGWCFPENIDTDKIKEVYGSDQLNDIMQGRKDNMNMTDKFEAWCKENNVEPQITELGEEATTSVDVTEQVLKNSTTTVTFEKE